MIREFSGRGDLYTFMIVRTTSVSDGSHVVKLTKICGNTAFPGTVLNTVARPDPGAGRRLVKPLRRYLNFSEIFPFEGCRTNMLSAEVPSVAMVPFVQSNA